MGDRGRPAVVLRLLSPVYSVAVLLAPVLVVALLDVGARPPKGAATSGLGEPVDGSAATFAVAWFMWRVIAAVAIIIPIGDTSEITGVAVLPAIPGADSPPLSARS
jgi:hypothetical protein